VSSDQSQPPRKVVPYKKGGRRQSPFSDIAFQFSGTALDVAIQQSQEESDSDPKNEGLQPGDEQKIAESVSSVEEANSLDEINLPDQEVTVSRQSETGEESKPEITTEDLALPDIHLIGTKARSRRSVSASRKNSPLSASNPSFQAFVDRWKHGLRRGQLKMCEVLFNKTHAIGHTECETSFSVLMHESGLSRRQSFQIISELEQMGFVERLETPKHITRKGTGSHIRFHLNPKV
jgi:hypothetical protein